MYFVLSFCFRVYMLTNAVPRGVGLGVGGPDPLKICGRGHSMF